MTGWVKRAIGELMASDDKPPRTSLQSDIQIWNLNLDQIESESGRVLSRQMVPREKLGPSTYPFEAGTVLYSKLRPYLNKVVVADMAGFATTELVPLRCDKQALLPEYLAYVLRSKDFVDFASTVVAGAKMPRMVMSQFWAYEIPLPPLPEQRRIAAILDQADALRAKRREALALLDSLTQSIFIEMFGDPVTNPHRWPRMALEQLMTSAGPQNGLYKPSTDYGLGTPILRIDAFYDGAVTKLDTLKRVRVTDVESSLYGLRESDVVINRVNSIEYLGKSAIIPRLAETTVFESNMMRFAIRPDIADAGYVVQFLQSNFVKAQIQSASKNAVNQSSINQQDVKAFQLNVPPLQLQRQFLIRSSAASKLKDAHRAALAELDTLFASLQHRAFRGEL